MWRVDPFPFNGHTTTCDAIWMGVPVVMLAGQTYASRFGGSVLTNVGLERLIAPTAQRYVELAIELAGDLAGLARVCAPSCGREWPGPSCWIFSVLPRILNGHTVGCGPTSVVPSATRPRTYEVLVPGDGATRTTAHELMRDCRFLGGLLVYRAHLPAHDRFECLSSSEHLCKHCCRDHASDAGDRQLPAVLELPTMTTSHVRPDSISRSVQGGTSGPITERNLVAEFPIQS